MFLEILGKLVFEYYKWDRLNYQTAASLAWDAMLLKTKIGLDLITGHEILAMLGKSKRAGLKFVGSKRYAKANNKHMGEHYASQKESTCITYVEANSLYGWAMLQSLPYKDITFETINPPMSETCPEAFRTIPEPNSARLLTNSETFRASLEPCPATLRTIL
jgi:hypothetical protein